MQTSERNKIHSSFIQRVMILIGIKVLIISFFFFYFLEKTKTENNPQFCFKEQCFELEIADTPEKRELGLMFRESLPKNKGMLFVFDQADLRSFWMRNTVIPLDIIWLDEGNKVIDIVSAAPCTENPCPSYLPQNKATSAIEVNSGTTNKIGLKIGDTIELSK